MYTERMNFVWNRDFQDALDEPYEYDAQEQFIREAESTIKLLFLHLMQSNRSFTRDDVSLKKAVWMLHVDACETLRDCVNLVTQKNHRIVIRLFRDIIETLDLAVYLQSGSSQSEKDLEKWFQNDIIENAKFRDYVGTISPGYKETLKERYRAFSKFTHRTYQSIAQSYILGKDEILAYEGEYRSFTLPHPVSLCCAILGNFVQFFVKTMLHSSLITIEQVSETFDKSLEIQTVERRFTTPRKVYQSYLSNMTDSNE